MTLPWASMGEAVGLGIQNHGSYIHLQCGAGVAAQDIHDFDADGAFARLQIDVLEELGVPCWESPQMSGRNFVSFSITSKALPNDCSQMLVSGRDHGMAYPRNVRFRPNVEGCLWDF